MNMSQAKTERRTYHVNALKRKVGRLVQEEVDNDGTRQVARREDETVTELDGTGDERREEGNEEVPEPVAGGGNGGLLGTRARGEGLTDENPDTGRPGHGVAENEQTCRHNHELADALVRGRVLSSTGGGEDEQPNGLPDTAEDKRDTTSEGLHDVETAERAAEVDSTENDLRDEGIVDTDRLEDRCAVLDERHVSIMARLAWCRRTHVEEVVSTRQLLEHLERRDQKCSVELLALQREAVQPASLHRLLVLNSLTHLLHLAVDDEVVCSLRARDTTSG